MKALYVMEMPTTCKKCDLCDVDEHGLYCKANKMRIEDENSKLAWCPLYKMPKKWDFSIEWINHDYQRGYNDCIVDIGGGDEEGIHGKE